MSFVINIDVIFKEKLTAIFLTPIDTNPMARGSPGVFWRTDVMDDARERLRQQFIEHAQGVALDVQEARGEGLRGPHLAGRR